MSRELLSWHRSFEQAIATYDPSKYVADVEEGEATRAQILTEFPLSGWPSLDVERFAQGTGNPGTDFCTWLEGRSPKLGNLPAFKASIHVIYKELDPQSGKRTWKFPSNYPNIKVAWQALREGYVRAFELAGQGKLAEIDGLSVFNPGHLTLSKALHVYFPDRILPISATNHLKFFALRVWRNDWKEIGALGHTALNGALLARLRQVPALANAGTLQLMRFLYDWTDLRKTPAVYKISPGEDAKFWAQCQSGRYVCVGWEDVGDLTKFADKSSFAAEFEKRYAKLYPDTSTMARKRNEVWSMHDIEAKAPGTIVLANKGMSQVLGVGKVEEPGYLWLKDRAEYNHGLRVNWEPDSGFALSSPRTYFGLRTVLKIEPSQFDDLFGDGGPQTETILTKVIEDKPPQTEAPKISRPDLPLNLILHGPPGTGKTYAMRAMRETFAIKPKPGAAKPALDVADLTWFETVALALHESGPCEVATLRTQPLIKAKYAERAPVTKLNPFIWNQLQTHTVKTSATVKYEFRTGQLIFDKKPDGTWFLPNGLPDDLKSLLGAQDPTPAASDVALENQFFVTFHPSFAYEDFVEGMRPEVNEFMQMEYPTRAGVFKHACERAIQLAGYEDGVHAFCQLPAADRTKRLASAPPVVLFIDEINRGNVARVLGELITLVEPDKRLGAEQELIVTLPGSRQRFGVPSNLWIIGTMNTADRSVVALDTALRRRFAFRECPPDPALLQGIVVDGVDVAKLLHTINQRLLRLRDRDHLIGHAFFLGLKAAPTLSRLRAVFCEAVVPLLLEYFHDDLGRVGLVLGGAFVSRVPTGDVFAKKFDHDHKDDLADRPAWELAEVSTLDIDAFKAIYA